MYGTIAEGTAVDNAMTVAVEGGAKDRNADLEWKMCRQLGSRSDLEEDTKKR